METFIITCNGNLINYKGKKGCNAQLLFHYILITLHKSDLFLFCNISVLTQQHLLADKEPLDIIIKNKNLLKHHYILEVYFYLDK